MFSVEECERHEWLLPFRTGGYASSTICGINSRTYHGYLVVPLNQPYKRYLILSKFEDFLVKDIGEFPLSTNHYDWNVYYPEGYKYIKEFKWGKNYVKWVYEIEGDIVDKEIIAHESENAITVRYKSSNGKIKVCPLITYRSHHLTTTTKYFFDFQQMGSRIKIFKEGVPILNFLIEGDYELEHTGYWYYNFFYLLDYERGNNHREDLYNPFCIMSNKNELSIDIFYDKESMAKPVEAPSDILRLLANASLSFIVKGKNGWSIIAGYHWFSEWGRDTFISMEGLMLLNGLYKQAEEIILRYLQYSEKGMFPNHITPQGEPIYIGVDVSLWAINSIYKLYLYSGDVEFIRKIYSSLQDIIDWYYKGNGIVYTRDFLLFHKGAPRTWMDASYDGRVVTPREGAAVEVNALWYNALMIMDQFSKIVGDNNTFYSELAKRVKGAFNEKFVTSWGLYDYLDTYLIPDTSIRPNQIFAFSLPFSVIDKDVGTVMLTTIENELLRPFGLSTLSRRDPKYKPLYRGDRASRDEAYHNGPIWPWLIGAYIDAKLKVENDIIKAKMLLDVIKPLLEYAKRNNGFIPELFEDLPPYLPRGCIAQAWSVAEVYRSVNLITSI
ncbi:MAG: amylo-alpha-1,6-glucosidase [Sulfolobus sp.]